MLLQINEINGWSSRHRASLRVYLCSLCIFLILASSWLLLPLSAEAQTGGLSQAEIEKLQQASPEERERMAKEFSNRRQPSRQSEQSEKDKDPAGKDVVQSLGELREEAEEAKFALQQEVEDYRTQVSLATDELQPFGYSLFAGKPHSFQPATEIPIPAEYRIGPGDVVRLQLFGQQNELYELPVNRDGTIELPKVGPVAVAGLSFDDMREQLKRQVAKRFIGVEASITLGELRSIRIFVMGEARNPGAYTVSSLSNITNALFVSGGVKVSGSLRSVKLMREGEIVTTLDLYDLLLRGDTSSDRRLMPGDVILIPPVGKTVAIAGQVLRPAIYELVNDSTIARGIELAGGFRSAAHPKYAKLQRIHEEFGRTIEDIDLTRAPSLQTKLEDGDQLTIGVINELIDGYVSLQGQARRTGNYEWRDGLRFSDLVDNLREDLSQQADLSYAMVVREINAEHDVTTLDFSPRSAVEYPGSNADPVLQERDRILIFHKTEPRDALLEPVVEQLRSQVSVAQPPEIVSISGEVRFPGTYPMPNVRSVQQLIQAAGGMLDSSYLGSAEVVRTHLGQEKAATSLLTTDIEKSGRSKKDITLEPLDRVHVKQLPQFGEDLTVTLEGEIRFPGTYPVRKGETLGSLIERAGGLTEHAYPEGAVFTREELRDQEAKRLEEAEQRLRRDIIALSVDESSQFTVAAGGGQDPLSKLGSMLDMIQSAEAVGRLVIDLPALLGKNSSLDVLLRDGDQLRVPQIMQSVTVIGEVQFPTSHLYHPKFSVDDYLERSGGGTRAADLGRMYVIRADGSVWLPRRSSWFGDSGGVINPGDTVVVPLDIDQLDKLQIVSELSQILYQITLGAAAVRSF